MKILTLEEIIIRCEESGIVIDYCNLSRYKGIALAIDEEFYIALDNSLKHASAALKREVLMHELAHIELNDFYLTDSSNVLHRSNMRACEAIADRWTIDMLLSSKLVKKSLKNNYFNIYAAAEELAVSYELLQRAIDLYESRGELKRYFETYIN